MDWTKFLPGLKVVGSGLLAALLPAAMQYMAGVDWTVFGVPALVSGLIGMALHMLPSPVAAASVAAPAAPIDPLTAPPEGDPQ